MQAINQWNAGDAVTHSHFTESVKKLFLPIFIQNMLYSVPVEML